MKDRRNHADGFTLVEVLIVVGVIAILAALALPQYERFLMKTKRADAIIALKATYTAQSAYFAANDHYATREYAFTVLGQGLISGPEIFSALGVEFHHVDGGDAVTRHGYHLFLYDCGALGGCASQLGKGFYAHGWADLDTDVTLDTLRIKANMTDDAGIIGPEGIPYIYTDDITNQ